MKTVDFAAIERKWQKRWEKEKIFQVGERSKRKKFYNLEMYPYPSGSGLHMGHALNYSIGDIYARLKRMQGFNVLYPMGFDSFGLPAENAAIQAKSHPKRFTDDAIKNYIKQMKELGLSYDWSRKIMSHDPEYYKWDQWIFLKLFEKGLAYRKKAGVNWCGKCNTVLANEQVQNGKCWRHGDTEVEIKQLEQWFFKTTEYADELYEGIDKLKNWPETIRKLQKNWIGKSHGSEILFEINGEEWPVFTTRPDTVFGVTFMVISAQHTRLNELVTAKQMNDVEKFLKRIKSVSEKEMDDLEKEGVFTGSYAINPVNGKKIPIYAGNFVLAEYGSGMVMAVPAHDQRDFEFAKKYDLEIREVVSKDGDLRGNLERAYTGEGILVNSGKFDGLKSKEAKEEIVKFLSSQKKGKKTVNFRLKDWLISRQRFWGTPIPVIYCDECGIVPVPEKDLPVKLPDEIKFESVENPLMKYDKFVKVECPKCGGVARRETDTMDTFVNSSWYFLRYSDPGNSKKIFDSKKANYWAPMDVYIGGKEHACLHLIYFRFYTKFLRDLGLLKFDEPANKLFNQGMLHAEDGRKMSKSFGNVVLPEVVSKKYGIDSARMFLVSVAGPDKDINWSDKGAEGSKRFVLRVLKFVENFSESEMSELQESKLHRAVRDYTEDLEAFRYNLAVIKLRSLFDVLEQGCSKEALKDFVKLFSVICPHVAEELWEKLGGKGFVSLADWPEFDKKKINDKLEEAERAVDKTVEDVKNILKIIKEKSGKVGNKIFIYVLPQEKKNYDSGVLSKKIGKEVVVYAVNDKDKHDPEGKSRKVKPERPGIYVE